MSFLVLDTGTAATATYWDMTVQLDGLQYVMEFLWSDRESCWYLNIGDQSDNPLASGVRLNVTWPLLRRFTNPALPQGLLICVDMTGTDTDIAAPSDLGQRVLLMYITADDPFVAAEHVDTQLVVAAGFRAPAGTMFASKGGDPAAPLWVNESDVTNGASNQTAVAASFVCQTSGVVPLPPRSLAITRFIDQQTGKPAPPAWPGWRSITNPSTPTGPLAGRV